MAHGGNGLFGIVEFTHDFQNAGVQTQVFRGAATGNNKACVVSGVYLVEIVVDAEVVSAFFRISLVALKVMDGRTHAFAGLFPGADCMHFIAQHLQHLERHHDFIILNIVASQHQNFFHMILQTGSGPLTRSPRPVVARRPGGKTPPLP